MTPHDHTTFVPGCFRCELGRDEARDSAADFPTQAVRCPRCDVEHSPSLPHRTVEDCNAALVGTRILNLEGENANLRESLTGALGQGQDDYQSIDSLGREVSRLREQVDLEADSAASFRDQRNAAAADVARLREAARKLIGAYMAGEDLAAGINELEAAAGLGQQG